ncbi:MAG: tetratricopeptide repeat protein [Bacteroidales bacterium]|nr:tetratricopeptide repeat protein [Bacteroidales bacterium]
MPRVSLLSVFIFCLNFLNAQPPTALQMEQARVQFNEGIRAGLDEDFEKADDFFSKAIEINPIYAEAFLYRGLSCIETGDYYRAIRDLTIAIELDPAFSDQAHYFRGVARYWRGEYHQALDDLSVAIHMNPDYVAFFQRGKVYMSLENYPGALQDFEIALRLNPDFFEAYLYRGVTLHHMGEVEMAATNMDAGRDYFPDHKLVAHYQELISQTGAETEKISSEPQPPGREINIADFFNRPDDAEIYRQQNESEASADVNMTSETKPLPVITEVYSPNKPEPAKETVRIEALQTGTYDFSLKGVNPAGFGVQVASYYNHENLANLAKAYNEKYRAQVFIHVSQVNGRKLFRLILGMFSERSEAESYRDDLRKADFPDSFLILFENL